MYICDYVHLCVCVYVCVFSPPSLNCSIVSSHLPSCYRQNIFYARNQILIVPQCRLMRVFVVVHLYLLHLFGLMHFEIRNVQIIPLIIFYCAYPNTYVHIVCLFIREPSPPLSSCAILGGIPPFNCICSHLFIFVKIKRCRFHFSSFVSGGVKFNCADIWLKWLRC